MSRIQSIATSRSCLALDNLRAVVILIVLAFHSMLSLHRVDPAADVRI